MRRETQYAQSIREDLAALGFIGRYGARHVEAYMRIEHPTLDALSPRQFRSEVAVAAECVDAAGPADAEALALSFGL